MLNPDADDRFQQWQINHGRPFALAMFQVLGPVALNEFFCDTAHKLNNRLIVEAMDGDYRKMMEDLIGVESVARNDSLILRGQVFAELEQILAGDDEAGARASCAKTWAARLVEEFFDLYHPMTVTDWMLDCAVSDIALIAVIGCTYPESELYNESWLKFINQRRSMWAMGW